MQQTLAQSHPTLPSSRAGRLALGSIIGAILGVTLLHYLTSSERLPYHSIYRSLYYVPLVVAAVVYGTRGGVLAALAVIVLYLPHIIGIGGTSPGSTLDNLLELPLFLLVGSLSGWLTDRERAQRRRAETLQHYIDDVLQSLPLGVATTDAAGTLVPRNRAATTLLHDAVTTTIVASVAVPYQVIEASARPLGVHVSPLHSPTPEHCGSVYVLEDLTDRRVLEMQVRRNDRLASVGQLAAGIAHEVRNPLAILRATAQLVALDLHDNPRLAEHARVLTSEADRIEQRIGELLDYARPRPPVPTTLDLHATLQQAVQAVRPYALQYRVSIAIEPGLGTVHADAQQIHQLLINLLLNAVQASIPGTTITVRAALDADQVQIVIADQGHGMTQDAYERACDPFFTTRADGTGLGLAIVAAVVAEHRGRLDIVSAPERGTTVTVSVPQL